MEQIKLAMELEKINLMTQIEAFNKKAEIVGIEKIPMSGETGDSDASQVEGKVFQHSTDAETYLGRMGWVRVSRYSDEWMKAHFVATVKINPTGNGWVIVTM